MNKYESVVIINPNVDEAGLKALEDKFTGLINANGSVTEVENMGKKKLAYDIKKNKEAYYMVFKFEANPTLIAELERVYRITDEVLKFITTRNID
ncbi:MAG: 30S ribosomal protein S6 [Clostridium sp. 26_21]|nr:MAG: 30S ribosomal protein S6 [Clostridium sp. 26_21]